MRSELFAGQTPPAAFSEWISGLLIFLELRVGLVACSVVSALCLVSKNFLSGLDSVASRAASLSLLSRGLA